MSSKRRVTILGSGLGLYFATIGLLGIGVLTQHDEAVRRFRAYLEPPTLAASEPQDATWAAHISRVDQALAEQDVGAAEQAWQDAYVAALGSVRWEGLIEVGDSALRIGEGVGSHNASEAEARDAYWVALVRARTQQSLDGILRAAERFAALGDREVAAGCVRIAEQLAAAPEAQARVRAVADRLTAWVRLP
jgi:hypothetical protein